MENPDSVVEFNHEPQQDAHKTSKRAGLLACRNRPNLIQTFDEMLDHDLRSYVITTQMAILFTPFQLEALSRNFNLEGKGSYSHSEIADQLNEDQLPGIPENVDSIAVANAIAEAVEILRSNLHTAMATYRAERKHSAAIVS